MTRRTYRRATRAVQDEEATRGRGFGEEESKVNIKPREAEEYYRVINKNTEFFSTSDPEDIFGELIGYLGEKGIAYEADDNKYKVTAKVLAAG